MQDVCKRCDAEITAENMRPTGYARKNGTSLYSRSECKACASRRGSESRRLRRQNPPPSAGSPCECCGRPGRQLVLDHDHITGAFRGFICHSCNMARGHLGDCPDGVAVDYLILKNARDPPAEGAEALG